MINTCDSILFSLEPRLFYEVCNKINLLPHHKKEYTRLLNTFVAALKHNHIHLINPCWTVCCNYWVMRERAPPSLGAAYDATRNKADILFLKLSVKVAQNYRAAIGRYQNPEKGSHLLKNIAYLGSLLPTSIEEIK